MTWDEFYEIWGESESARDVIKHLSSLETVGPQDEIADVIADIGNDCKTAGDLLLQIALNKGSAFNGENLVYISDCCEEDTWRRAIDLSAKNFTTADLEELWSTLDDEEIKVIAEKYHLALPQDMLDEMEEESDWEQDLEQEYYTRSANLSYLIGEADYALECLQRAYDNLTYSIVNSSVEHRSERKGLWGHRYWSKYKYEYAEAANAELEAAEEALSNLGVEQQQWNTSQRQRLTFDRRIKTLDVWSRNSLGGVINSEKIRRTWRQLETTIPEVRALRDELQRTYDELTETYERYQERKNRR
ncbi:MAG: hypothetical protein IKT45_10510 [Lachnospiraceae bacterium]|nr:hypothetical protein [Lachnospiraceae bacterium]